jgi:hypothetical protein
MINLIYWIAENPLKWFTICGIISTAPWWIAWLYGIIMLLMEK